MIGRPHRTGRPKELRELFKTASVSQVAKWVKRQPSTVSAWIQVPAEHVLTIEKHTGISRYTLRADIYGAKP